MFSKLIFELIGKGLSEAQIAADIGMSQASVNRIKLGKQKRIGYETADRLRQLHARHCLPVPELTA